MYEAEDGYFYDQHGNYLEGYVPGGDHGQLGYDNGNGQYYAEGGYYDENGNWVDDQGGDYYEEAGDSRAGSWSMRQLTSGNEIVLKNALDELGDDDDDDDYDDVSRPMTREGGGADEVEPTGDSIQDEIARTRERVKNMKMKPLEGGQKVRLKVLLRKYHLRPSVSRTSVRNVAAANPVAAASLVNKTQPSMRLVSLVAEVGPASRREKRPE